MCAVRSECAWLSLSPAAAAALIVTLSPGAVGAAPGQQGVRLDVLQPSSPESHFVRAEGPHAKGDDAVEFATIAGLEYASRPVRAVGVDEAGEETALGDLARHAVLARLGASVTPGGILSLEVNVPIALFVNGEDDRPITYAGEQATPAQAEVGIGDPRFGVHGRLLDTPEIDVIAGGRLWAPVGSQSAFLSDRRLRGEIHLGAAGEVGALLYGGTIAVAPGFFAGRDGDRIAASLAAHVLPISAFSLGIEPSLVLLMDERAEDDRHVQLAVEALAAFKLRVGPVRLGLAGGPVFGDAAGAGEIRGLFTVALTGGSRPPPPPRRPIVAADRDFDAIKDDRDACPDEAGPDSRDAARRGCPARDQDADGVRDDEDACPSRAGVSHPDPKANGCLDGDNDAVPDPLDSCPAEPGSDPFGCPKYARVEGNRVKIDPPIRFEGDKLSQQGRAALEEVAATVRANPKIEQVSIGIGTTGASAQVSDDRAKAILLILRAGYLDQSRYEVVLRDDLKAGVVEIRIVK